MIEGTPQPTPAPSPQKSDGDMRAASLIAGFSFPMAVAAAEARASQSIGIFGAAPQSANLQETATREPNARQTGSTPAANEPEGAVTPSAQTLTAKTTSQTSTPLQTAQGDQQTQQQNTQSGVVAAPAIAAAPLQSTLIQPTPSLTRIEAAGLREVTTAKANASKPANAPAPAARPQSPTVEIAQLLARRLNNGATSFELRLDPPSLGRVEANLKVAENGETLLSLKFENQSAFDQFTRDEAQLRDVLTASGFDLPRERMMFSLAGADELFGDAMSGAASIVTDHSEPMFSAPYSSGAVDIRV